MSGVIIFNKVGKSQVYEPSKDGHWIKFIITELGCEIAEYQTVNDEVHKTQLAHYREYQSVAYMREKRENIAVPSMGSPPDDEFTEAALKDRDPDDKADYGSLKPPHFENIDPNIVITPKSMTATEVDQRTQDWAKETAKKITNNIVEKAKQDPVGLYSDIQEKSKKNKPERLCHTCNSDITDKHPNAKFCSQKCKDKFHNRKLKEKTHGSKGNTDA